MLAPNFDSSSRRESGELRETQQVPMVAVVGDDDLRPSSPSEHLLTLFRLPPSGYVNQATSERDSGRAHLNPLARQALLRIQVVNCCEQVTHSFRFVEIALLAYSSVSVCA